ncbi:hypothetical protein B0H13DRAFT_1881563 [Mycena leptocephala]|nr:hypothetical protein B0H13DRAFT_1881563 [Mycena leptocephala]
MQGRHIPFRECAGLGTDYSGKRHVSAPRSFPPPTTNPPPPLAPTSPPTRQKRVKIPTDGTNNSKHSATDQLFIDRVWARWLIDFHTYVFSYQIQDSTSLPVAWPFEIADLNCKRHSHGDGIAIEPNSKAQYYSVMLALIAGGQQDEARVQRDVAVATRSDWWLIFLDSKKKPPLHLSVVKATSFIWWLPQSL